MGGQQYEYDGWSYERLRAQRNRAHFLLVEPYRYVTVVLSTRLGEEKKLYCIDSPCYHAAGPLLEGDLVEIEDTLCVRCPWHQFLVSLDEGREILLEADSSSAGADAEAATMDALPTYPLRGVDPKASHVSVVRGRRVQRTHMAALDEATGVLTITIEDPNEMKRRKLRSDEPAEDVKAGAMCMQVFDIKSKSI